MSGNMIININPTGRIGKRRPAYDHLRKSGSHQKIHQGPGCGGTVDQNTIRCFSANNHLKQQDGVLRVEYVSGEKAWEEFQEDYFAGNEDAAEGFADDNPLINSNHYEVYMSDVSKQQDIVEHAQSLEGVGNVNKSDVVAKTLTRLNSLIWYVSIAIIAILLAVSVFLISNTVTMGVTVRREEIAIMKYIGAKDGFVRAPFVIEGLIIGIVGAIIPLILLYFMYNKAVEYIMTRFSLLNNIIDFIPVMDVYRTLLPVGLALGAGIGFLGSFITIRKHLRA